MRRKGEALEIDVADDAVPRLAVLIGIDEASAENVQVVSKDASIPARRGRPETDEPAIRYWLEKEPPHTAAPGAANEVLYRLRALGYIN